MRDSLVAALVACADQPLKSEARRFLAGPIEKDGAHCEVGREAVALLMREGPRLGFGRGEAAMPVVRAARAVVPIVFESDERARARAGIQRGCRLLNHATDHTRAYRSCAEFGAISIREPRPGSWAVCRNRADNPPTQTRRPRISGELDRSGCPRSQAGLRSQVCRHDPPAISQSRSPGGPAGLPGYAA